MAKIVIGIGSSQSPLVSIPAEHWGAYGRGDETNTRLFMPDGSRTTYEQLAAAAGDKFKDIVAQPLD